MKRTLPAVWSSIVASPFLVVGVDGYVNALALQVPTALSQVALLVGLSIALFGIYVHAVAGSAFEPEVTERSLNNATPRTPFVRAKAVVGLCGLCLACYWLFYTHVPYVYPTIALVVGALLFATGVWTYWLNSLTTYYLTNKRLVTETRLLGTNHKNVQLEMVKTRTVARPFYLRLFGLGNIKLDTGARRLALVRHIREAKEFERSIADAIQKR
ncbi:membrane-flanked domain protein [Halogeometricum pallidum JCM 14848]|uniref:Membrane-flanked domain protein n=1 Tax=Halogeometricum pallidum JCM 14848 TaxID=1227487 RepID=M0CX90_HALPD|nr:PH domain-containing protein [Halogeometricum pallidum]ELZ27037.1 membrane-flanked domain protein [Halogeometricum pallidum JCM 14848]